VVGTQPTRAAIQGGTFGKGRRQRGPCRGTPRAHESLRAHPIASPLGPQRLAHAME
jgi:hypothetical protein